MSGRLQGKRALVTAAAQGIGAATARAFASEGAVVVASEIKRLVEGADANARTLEVDQHRHVPIEVGRDPTHPIDPRSPGRGVAMRTVDADDVDPRPDQPAQHGLVG